MVLALGEDLDGKSHLIVIRACSKVVSLLTIFLASLWMCVAANANNLEAISAEHKADGLKIKAVVAREKIGDGQTISANQLRVQYLPAKRIWKGVASSRHTVMQGRHSHYVDNTSDATGCLSLGIRAGDVLYQEYSGFRGEIVVTAKCDIKAGEVIEANALTEARINPDEVPIYACSFEDEVLHKISNGIRKGEIVVVNKDGHGKRFYVSVKPGLKANQVRYFVPVALRRLAKDRRIKPADIKVMEMWQVARRDDLSLSHKVNPIGRRSKYEILPGQIVRNSDLLP